MIVDVKINAKNKYFNGGILLNPSIPLFGSKIKRYRDTNTVDNENIKIMEKITEIRMVNNVWGSVINPARIPITKHGAIVKLEVNIFETAKYL